MSKYRHGFKSKCKVYPKNDFDSCSVLNRTAGISSAKASSHLLDHGYGATPVYGNRATTTNMGSNSKRCSMPAKYSSNESQITSYYRVSVLATYTVMHQSFCFLSFSCKTHVVFLDRRLRNGNQRLLYNRLCYQARLKYKKQIRLTIIRTAEAKISWTSTRMIRGNSLHSRTRRH